MKSASEKQNLTAFPSTWEVAKALANDIINHPEHYRLRHRCIVKVTTADIHHAVNMLGHKISLRTAGFFFYIVFTHLDYILEKHGYKLIEKRVTGNKTHRYYLMPNCRP